MSTPLIKRCIGIISLLAVIGALTIWHFKPNTPIATAKSVAIQTGGQPTLGNPKARVHIVAFEDLKCGNCMRFNTTIFPKLKKTFIDTGKAKFTFINLAFIQGSLPAANAARCLYQQNKAFFFPYIETLYRHQPPENEDWATIPRLVNFASGIPRADKNALADCIYNSPHTPFIQNNLKIAEKAMGNGIETPTLFINGHRITPLTWPSLKKAIEHAMGESI